MSSPNQQIPANLKAKIAATRKKLDDHVCEIVDWHFNPKTGSPFWLEDRGHIVSPENIVCGPRIGCEFAGEAAHWPWRFWERGSHFVK